jgi:hypothetical protein
MTRRVPASRTALLACIVVVPDAGRAETGVRLWRFWTIPGPGEPGHDIYDSDLHLLSWGIGNPGPDWNGDARPGETAGGLVFGGSNEGNVVALP